MLTHVQIWAAIDALAKQCSLSASGLARNSGLDPTTFNRSKRFTSSGRERWPSTESIAKILKSTNTSVEEFTMLISQPKGASEDGNIDYKADFQQRGIPMIGFAKAGHGGFFDTSGIPTGQGWRNLGPLFNRSESSYALRVSGDAMMPLYRDGDILIVDPAVAIRRGDRLVAKSHDGGVFASIMERKTDAIVELKSLKSDEPNTTHDLIELEWMARIIWASQ
ncbi:MAG: helix-turn-helix transcriptional regulator [Pseudomonadota bacterium]